MSYQTNFKRLSVGNFNSVLCDTIIMDNRNNQLVFASMIGYSTLIDLTTKALNGLVVNCYSPEAGSARTLKNGYDIEIRRQNDSDYVHALAFAKDYVEQQTDNSGEKIAAYIFCQEDEGVNDQLFDKLSKYSSVPILREWMPYIKDQLLYNDRLLPLDVTTRDEVAPMVAYALFVTKNALKNIISTGLKEGQIDIMGVNSSSDIMANMTGLNSYLEAFGEILAEKIQNSFRPKFIPGEDQYDAYANDIDDFIYTSGIEMYEAQKSAVQAVVNNLKVNDNTFLISEMGSGKSLMGAIIPYIHHSNKYKGFNSIVMCPSHLTIKWKREIERAVPNSRAFILKDFSDLKKLEERLGRTNKVENTYVIVSKERAKMGYDLRPAVKWSRSKNTFVCPECGKTLYKVEYEGRGRDKRAIHVPFNETDMIKEYAHNAVCMNEVRVWNSEGQQYETVPCGNKLWTPLNRDDLDTGWIKLGSEGWILKDHIVKLTEAFMDMERLGRKDTALFNRLFEQYQKIEEGEEPSTAYKGPKKYPIAKYIRERMKGVFDYCIIDEAHSFKGLTEQGQAAADLIQASGKSVLLTGTLLNGYADGLFYLLYRTVPQIMRREGFDFSGEAEFARVYGVTSKEHRFSLSRGTQAGRIGSAKEKRLPGVSPLVFTRFLLNNAVFLSLADMSDGLPDYQEIPIPIRLDDELYENYGNFERAFRELAAPRRGQSRKVVGPLLQELSIYPDAPHCVNPIMHPDTGEIAYEPVRLNKATREKELALLELVQERLARGDKVLVYYSAVNKTDIGSSLVQLLKDNNINAFEMKSNTAPDKREEWVETHINKGMQVMVCNPSLVETGLDLLDFTSIVFFQVGYNLFTMRQASRRSWRLSQTKGVKVYFMYYQGTIQEQALSLMATKLQASMAIEGKFSEEGLRAMSNNEDMLTQIANNVVEGIKDTVNEELFKATAFNKATTRTIRPHYKTRRELVLKMNEDGIKALFSSRFNSKPRKTFSKASVDKVENILNLFC
jgi:SNF2 family DNA or RNA helicase